MATIRKRLPIEICFTLAMLVCMVALSVAFGLPIRLPTSNGAAFIGLHYLYPLIGLAIWGGCALLGQRSGLVWRLFLAVPCYALVLIAHFNIKLWAPLIHPASYDALYWSIDQSLRPLVDFCIGLRKLLAPAIPYEIQLYMYGFILLFYCSFCYHALRTPAVFRQLFVAVLFLQGLGALCYLLTPAVGPFIYENGASPVADQSQQYMLQAHQAMLGGGHDWLSAHASEFLLAGLGAMPSLHVAGSALFLWFAIKHARVLLPAYVPLFGFILITSVANRWHYLIDIPAGFALTAMSIWLSRWFTASQAESEAEQQSAVEIAFA